MGFLVGMRGLESGCLLAVFGYWVFVYLENVEFYKRYSWECSPTSDFCYLGSLINFGCLCHPLLLTQAFCIKIAVQND